jgi:hypothetical protein
MVLSYADGSYGDATRLQATPEVAAARTSRLLSTEFDARLEVLSNVAWYIDVFAISCKFGAVPYS